MQTKTKTQIKTQTNLQTKTKTKINTKRKTKTKTKTNTSINAITNLSRPTTHTDTKTQLLRPCRSLLGAFGAIVTTAQVANLIPVPCLLLLLWPSGRLAKASTA